MDAIERLVALQLAEEVGAQAHHGVQAAVLHRLAQERREAAALPVAGTDIEFLALVDIEQEGHRLGMLKLRVAAGGLVDQVGEGQLAAEQGIAPFGAAHRPFGAGAVDLPSFEEYLHQRPHRFGAGAHAQETPAAAFAEGVRPSGRRRRGLRPALALERRQHAGLGERRFADARIAEKDRQPFGRLGERGEDFDGLAFAAEEIVAVLLLHRGETAIGGDMAPEFSRAASVAGRGIHQLAQAGRGRRLRRDDPVQLPQERKPGRRLAVEEHEDDREARLLHTPIDGLVIFGHLPRTEALLADQQHEGRGIGDLLCQFRQPVAASAQAARCKEDMSVCVLLAQRGFKGADEREVLRVVAKKPAPHGMCPAFGRRRVPCSVSSGLPIPPDTALTQ